MKGRGRKGSQRYQGGKQPVKESLEGIRELVERIVTSFILVC